MGIKIRSIFAPSHGTMERIREPTVFTPEKILIVQGGLACLERKVTRIDKEEETRNHRLNCERSLVLLRATNCFCFSLLGRGFSSRVQLSTLLRTLANIIME
jgi:hypothetical protein